MALIHNLLDRHKAMVGRRSPWMNYWQQLADVLLPNQADFTSMRTPGEQRGTGIYDGSPRLALRDLASTLDGLLKSKTSQWFDVAVDDEDLGDTEEVKRWLEAVKERMWDAIYRTKARFIQRGGEVDLALSCFGWGVLWIQENRLRNGLLFRSFHNSQVTIDENDEGIIDVIAVEEESTARQADMIYRKAGKDAPREIRDALTKSGNVAEQKFKFVQIVLPREDRQADAFGPRGMEFRSALIDVKAEAIVSESGFAEFPAAVPRWETSPGEIYPRGPGMMALPDAKTLQAMGKTLLVGGQRAVDPPIWVLNDSVMSPLRTMPGGVTVLDNSDSSGAPVGVFPVSTNLPLGREMQNDYRKQVEAAFFKNVFSLPIEGPDMTATEVIARKEEFIRVIGPVFGRLESDYIGHVVARVFGIMERAGAFPQRPDIMLEQKVTFRFQSPIQQARKQLEIAGLSRSLQLLAPLAAVQPEIMDVFDGEQIARDSSEWGTVPTKWIKSKRAVEEMREGKQSDAQQNALLAAAGPVSSAIKNVATAEAAVAPRLPLQPSAPPLALQ